jgi:uncharacterized protein (TIGR02246 family)
VTGLASTAIVVALATVSVGSSPMQCNVVSNPGDRPIEPILETFDAWKEALRAGDLDAIGALVAEDAEFWTHSQPALRGRDALRAAMAPVVDSWVLEQTFVCDELLVADGLAVARGTEINRLTSRDGDEEVVRRQRAFSILREGEDGVWRFARGMTSPAPEGS